MDTNDETVVIAPNVVDLMVAHCLRAFPLEGCGLLLGDSSSIVIDRAVGTDNEAKSSRVYTIAARDLLRIDREAERTGHAIVGVFHSHTHTDPYPSPTDVAQAPDSSWHYVLVSLRDEVASVRSYRIIDGLVIEEAILENDDRGGKGPALGTPGNI